MQSVLTQDFNDLELIVIDDGSTDDTPQVVAKMGDPRVRYVRFAQNRGIGAARHEAVTQARGELVAFADSDDVWLPGKLRYQVDLLHNHPHIDLVFGDYQNLNYLSQRSDKGFDQTRQAFSHLQVKALEPEIWQIVAGLPEVMLAANVIGTCSMVVLRRVLFEKIGNFDSRLSGPEDFELWWRAALKGATFAYTTRSLIERHKDEKSITAQAIRFGPQYLQALDQCEAAARSAQRDDLLPHIDRVRYRIWRGLIRDYALAGRRREACGAFRQSLRYRLSLRACAYFVLALLGANAAGTARDLKTVARAGGP
jgi:GT2 family glycosyltransferase